MELEALERQSGSYGTVNAGDTVTVPDQLGEELLKNGCFKPAEQKADPATADDVVQRNTSGGSTDAIHTDGTERELLNTDGRKLHDPQADQIVPAQQEIEQRAQKADEAAAKVADQKEVDPLLPARMSKESEQDPIDEKAHQDAVAAQKEAKPATGRQTKEDKASASQTTK